MRAMLVGLVAGAAVCLPGGPTAWTAPRPSDIPLSWQLEFDYQDPQAIQLSLPGSSGPATFWFIRFRITNRTGQDQIFVPDFVLYTDTGQVLHAGRKVPSAVFDAIKQIYNDPLMKEMTAMTGKFLQGEDNAKEGVAIWTDFDPAAGAFDIFVGGLNGESAEVQLPVPVTVTEMDYTGQTKTVTKEKLVLTKTLQLSYAIPGEAAARGRTKAKPTAKQWVMR